MKYVEIADEFKVKHGKEFAVIRLPNNAVIVVPSRQLKIINEKMKIEVLYRTDEGE